ncbi:MAG: YSC84-related protein [Desulfobacterales bacterium]|jgi:lipid-binding SYLF domain-containing protein
MKLNALKSTLKFSNVLYIAVFAVIFVIFMSAQPSFGKTPKEYDASVDAALDRFNKQVKDANEVVRRAKGLLVLPNVKKGALIVGGEYGRGALRIGGKSVDYYSMITGSVGLQIGGQAKDIIIAFMTQEALDKFRASKGWEAGVDGNVALVTIGAGESAISSMGQDPIVAFVFDVKGLIADMSIKGAKFNKLDKSKLE